MQDDFYRADLHRAGRQGLLLWDRKPHRSLTLQTGGVLGAVTGGQRTLGGAALRQKDLSPGLVACQPELWVRAVLSLTAGAFLMIQFRYYVTLEIRIVDKYLYHVDWRCWHRPIFEKRKWWCLVT